MFSNVTPTVFYPNRWYQIIFCTINRSCLIWNEKPSGVSAAKEKHWSGYKAYLPSAKRLETKWTALFSNNTVSKIFPYPCHNFCGNLYHNKLMKLMLFIVLPFVLLFITSISTIFIYGLLRIFNRIVESTGGDDYEEQRAKRKSTRGTHFRIELVFGFLICAYCLYNVLSFKGPWIN